LAGLAAFLSVVAFTARVHGQIGGNTVSQLDTALMSLLPEATIDPLVDPPGQFHTVKPQEFDPAQTNLVQAAWLNGTGCPTNAFIALPNATFTGVGGTMPFTDAACPTGDPNDQRNQGLLLAKTGPTGNFASATAELINVKGITLTELGYDIRKPLSSWIRVDRTAAQAHRGSMW